MSVSILATKLYAPPPRPRLVLRPRLIEKLNEGLLSSRRLTIISAPAGFGKTTLVSEWSASCERPVAWLSLDEADHDSTRFLTYLVASLQTIVPSIGTEVVGVLQSSQPPSTELIMTSLLNEIAIIPDKLILVLDDYHMVDARLVDTALTFLLEHLPPHMHLVITTREDPNLPLARFRVRNQLTELRVSDLRFTPSEAAEFLNQVMGLSLSLEDVAKLETRTEGWIAGLQLAALSMQGHQDVHGFIQAFAGDHQYIVDYLIEEVLQRQPESIRRFLLQTSILDRLNGPLCDAITGQSGGKEQLETLRRGNFFLIPLDDKRHWYRYHHLFADVLQMHMKMEQPDELPVLHSRASEWYEQNGSAADAIRHALAGVDFERAADLIERALPVMQQSRQESTLLGWLQELPDELYLQRPVLSVHYAGTLLQNGRFDGVEFRLRDAERWLDMPADLRERSTFVDEEDFQRLPGLIAQYHAAIALARGDVTNTMKYSREVLALAREDDYFLRGAASSLLGLASWTSGDLETAHRTYSDGMAYFQRIGFISDVIGGSVTLADIRITQGRLREAMSTYERGLQLATKQGVPALRGAADMHVGMSELYRERNDLHTAMQHLLKSKELGEFNGLPKNPYRWRVAMARLRQAEGDLAGAIELLDEAEPRYTADFSPNVRPIAALRTRVWIAQGKLGEALGWTRERGLSAHDDLSYLREFEHITLARILFARYKSDGSESALREAIGFLERLLKAAQEGGRTGSVIEVLVLQALAHQAAWDLPTANAALERALILAEPEGYFRIFLDEGADMAKLLREVAKRGIMPSFTGNLLTAIGAEVQELAGESPLLAVSPSQPLVEPLSQREMEILRLLQTELSVPEIAGELVIAASTVRSHTKSIYSKLDVNNRRAAVKRASELNLI
jgi:LuxR family transcriptional regulator, maltose regulon positive regulatory protein